MLSGTTHAFNGKHKITLVKTFQININITEFIFKMAVITITFIS